MTPFDLKALLNQDLESLGLTLPPGADKALIQYLGLVLEANQSMNLTAITDPQEAVHKHLVDSLSVLLLKDLAAQAQGPVTWTDIGSGAGFPGLVLALAVPQAQLHLVESTGKKAHFLNTTAASLGLLKRVQVHNQRAELLGQGADPGISAKAAVPRGTSLRGLNDTVFFRGVSRLNALIELGAPLLKLGGLLVAYKGPKAEEELAEAAKALKELKMERVERKPFQLPGVNEARVLVCLKKVGETPKRYPRPVGLAQKEPLL
jgi:16S rRNA (guanine527-N7)-methyltransferase